MTIAEKSIRIIAFQDGETWVAQCVDHDVATQAPNFDKLVARMNATLDAEIKHSRDCGRDAFEGIDPAPAFYTAMWDAAVNTLPMPGREYGEMKIAA